jgi:hypothetical protein
LTLATANAWEYLGWVAKNSDGSITRLPAESFGPLPLVPEE